jgi:alpha-mannosidase
LHAAQVLEHDGSLPAEHSFITVTPDNVVLTAVKKSEDADALILHFYEWAGKETKVKIEVPAGASSAELTDLMENPSGKVLSVEAGSVTVPVGKYAIESLRVNYPVKGTGAQ